jgi:toxin ParE1/3/4
MTWTLRQTQQAREDIFEIWDHIAGDNLAAADRLIGELLDLFEKTAAFPELGRAAPEVADHHRVLTRGNYILIYALDHEAKVSELVRVVHGARDWLTLFDDS